MALAGGQFSFQRQLGQADDCVHRCTDFVADVGEKQALGLVGGLRGILGRAQLRFKLSL